MHFQAIRMECYRQTIKRIEKMNRKLNRKKKNIIKIVLYYYIAFQRVYFAFHSILNTSITYYKNDLLFKFLGMTSNVLHLFV